MQQPSHWRPCFYPAATSLRCPGYCKTKTLLWTAHIFWCNPPPLNSSVPQSVIHFSQSLCCAGLRVQHCCSGGTVAGAESWLDMLSRGYSSWLSLGPPCHSTVSNLKTKSKSAASHQQLKQCQLFTGNILMSWLQRHDWKWLCNFGYGMFVIFMHSKMLYCKAYLPMIFFNGKKGACHCWHWLFTINSWQALLYTQTGWDYLKLLSSIKLTMCHVLFGQ